MGNVDAPITITLQIIVWVGSTQWKFSPTFNMGTWWNVYKLSILTQIRAYTLEFSIKINKHICITHMVIWNVIAFSIGTLGTVVEKHTQ